MAFQRLVKLIVTPIMGTWDEDGNLLGENSLPPEAAYHPYEKSVRELVRRLEAGEAEEIPPRLRNS
jgi:hypothetical protein